MVAFLPRVSFSKAQLSIGILLLQFNVSLSFSQQNPIDSWVRYESLAEAVGYDSLNLAMIYSDSAYRIAKKHGLSDKTNQSLLNLATFSSKLDLYDTSFYFIDRALEGFLASGNAIGASRAYNRRGINFQSIGDYDKSLKALFASLEILEEAGMIDSAANTYENISNAHLFLSQHERSRHYAMKAFEIRTTIHSADTVDSFMNLGIIFMRKGDYPQSLEYYLKALFTHERESDAFGISQVHSNLGILYRRMRRYDEAEQSLKLALEYQENHGLRLLANRSHNNLGNLYLETKQYEKGKYHLEQALKVKKAIGSEQDLWIPNLNLGYFHDGIGETEEALRYFEMALELVQTTKNQYGINLAKVNIASCHSKLGHHSTALNIAKETIADVEDVDDLSFKEYAYYTYYTIYESAGELETAIEYFKDYVTAKDSLMNQKKVTEMAELESSFTLAAKESEIELLNQQAQELELKSEVAILHRTLLGVAFLALIVIGALLFFTQRLKIRGQERERKYLEQEVAQLAKDMANKNKLLNQLKANVAKKVDSEEPSQSNADFMSLFKLIEQSLSSESEWVDFQQRFSKIHPTFLPRLEKNYSDLTDNDLRLAALLRLRMTSKEIANAINIEHGSVQKGRYRLKKKLGLDTETDLVQFLISY